MRKNNPAQLITGSTFREIQTSQNHACYDGSSDPYNAPDSDQ
jgi:hypothetical protein